MPLTQSNLGELRFERSGFRPSDVSGGFSRPGANLGEHNETILREVFGLSPARVAELVE